MFPELPPARLEALRSYEELLRERAVRVGLIGASDADRVGERHVRDSLRALAVLRGDDRSLADVGSGAGLPGMALAIARPELPVTLVEPRQRAVGFLELVRERLRLPNVEILHDRVEDVALVVDVVTTRAFGPLERSWEAATRVLRPGGRLIYFAGGGLADPERVALEITSPEGAAAVEVERVIADSSPLVIMTRASP